MIVNVGHLLEGKRGEAFVEAMRALAIMSGGKVMCGSCKKKATHIGMQECGQPGGPVCKDCLEAHRAWMNTAELIAEVQPYCRHCSQDVGREHIYAVDLYDSNAERVVM